MNASTSNALNTLNAPRNLSLCERPVGQASRLPMNGTRSQAGRPRHISSILSQAAFGIASSILALLAAVTPARAQATPVLDQLATHNLVRDSPSSGKPGKGKPVKATSEGNDPIEFSPASVTRNRKEDALMESFRNSFAMGAAIPGAELNQAERRLLFANFNTVTPENCMKPVSLQPVEGRFRFAEADALVNMAHANGLTVNAHTLLWHNQCPDWFFTDGGRPAGRELVLRRLRAHIAAVAGHFAGKVQSWDVVNEAIDNKDGYLRKSKWLTSIGEDFIPEAFIAAHKADPKAELYYNDYSIERRPKRDKVLRLLHDLKQRGAPIHGIGIQGHWQLDHIPFQAIEDAILAFHAEGMNIAITELDIDVGKRKTDGADVGRLEQGSADLYANGLPDDFQQRLADQYAKLFALFLKHQDKITRVTFWGLHDGRSWLNGWPFKRTNHPLFWDRALQAKPALSAVLALTREQTEQKIAKEPRRTAPPL